MSHLNLNLKKPLAVFDLETTGVQVATDRIVELSILKIMPDGSRETKTRRINPGMPIPAEASAIHGIYDEDVKDSPKFEQVAKSLADYLADSDLAGYNCLKFDIPVLVEEFLRAGIDFDISRRNVVDAQNIFHKMEPRTLKAAYKFYCGKELVNAHSAEADTEATFEVLNAQVDVYKDVVYEDGKGNQSVPVTSDVAQLAEFSRTSDFIDLAGRIVRNEQGAEVFNFGKHKGRAVAEVFALEPSYYDWMMKGDFTQDTKKHLTRIRLASR